VVSGRRPHKMPPDTATNRPTSRTACISSAGSTKHHAEHHLKRQASTRGKRSDRTRKKEKQQVIGKTHLMASEDSGLEGQAHYGEEGPGGRKASSGGSWRTRFRLVRRSASILLFSDTFCLNPLLSPEITRDKIGSTVSGCMQHLHPYLVKSNGQQYPVWYLPVLMYGPVRRVYYYCVQFNQAFSYTKCNVWVSFFHGLRGHYSI